MTSAACLANGEVFSFGSRFASGGAIRFPSKPAGQAETIRTTEETVVLTRGTTAGSFFSQNVALGNYADYEELRTFTADLLGLLEWRPAVSNGQLLLPQALPESKSMTQSAAPSRADLFVTVTFPVLVVVIAAAWVMYTRLDDSINATRLEMKTDMHSIESKLEQKLETTSTKIDALQKSIDNLGGNFRKEITTHQLKLDALERKAQ